MQLKIRHDGTDLVLPIAYHSILQGIIYNNLRSVSSYSHYLHDNGFAYDKRKYKMFTFSDISGNAVVRDKKITFRGKMEWIVSSVDPFMIHILKENIESQGIYYGKTHIEQVECILMNETVEDTTILIRMESPIVVYTTNEEKKTDYKDPSQEEFYYLIFANFARKYESCFGEKPIENIEMAPVKIGKRDKIITYFKDSIIEGYKGIYALRGPRKYLDFLLQTGLGSKNSQGFGMFSITNEEE